MPNTTAEEAQEIVDFLHRMMERRADRGIPATHEDIAEMRYWSALAR